jgi:hypothetical protein
MNKTFASAMRLPLLLAAAFFIQGCFKDTVRNTYRYTIYTPVYKTLQEVREGIIMTNPVEISYPGKIYIKDKYLFVSESYKGIHVIDNSNPSEPKNIGFIAIPSNADMAIKNNTLYADMYADLITIDISDLKNVKYKTVIPKIFIDNSWYLNDDKVIVDWDKKDTVVYSKKDAVPKGDERWYPYPVLYYNSLTNDAMYSNSAPTPSSYGTGGSMARFTALSDRLYTVGYQNLGVFNISDDFNPVFVARKNLGWGIETIFPFKGNLFIGTTTGVKIFSIANLDNPVETGTFAHVRSCDPVVANDDYAFATLRAGSTCGGNSSELSIISISNFAKPSLVKSYSLENPYGLGLDGNILFICDGTAGLKIYDVTDVQNLKLITTIKNINPMDVIPINGLAIVVGREAIYQYDYKNINNIKLLSSTKLNK